MRAVLRDEMFVWYKKNSDTSQQAGVTTSEGAATQPLPEQKDGEMIINLVGKSVTAIMGRLNSLSTFDGTESKVGQLVAAACSTDNLCRMDPAWHPWL